MHHHSRFFVSILHGDDVPVLSESTNILFDLTSLLGVLIAESGTEVASEEEKTAADGEDDDDNEDTFKAASFSAILFVLFGLEFVVLETDGGDGVDFSRAILSFTDKGAGDASDILK